jgi:opacity protein-like surface antigen
LYIGGDINPDLPASNYWYGSLSAGFGSQSDVDLKALGIKGASVSFNGAFSFNGAVGYQFEQVRAELEVGNQFFSAKEVTAINGSSQLISGNLSATTILVNGYYDIPTGSKFRPYVGGGLGLGIIGGKLTAITDISTLSSTSADSSGTSFAYQLKAGVQYEIAKKGNVFGELKYSSISSYGAKEKPIVNNTPVQIDIGPYNSFSFAVGYRQGF